MTAERAREANEVADEIDGRIDGLEDRSTGSVRRVRREYSKQFQDAPAADVVAVAMALRDRQRWVGYELIYHHPDALSICGVREVEALGEGLDGWVAVDTFCRYISGPAWQREQIEDDDVRRWARSEDRFWRRAALASTVPLNLRAAGGTGDPRRTLDICAMLVDDRDDLVVKAMSWALRELIFWDEVAVRDFVARYEDFLAARVKREVRKKLETGLKN